jgi:hypothetical protein
VEVVVAEVAPQRPRQAKSSLPKNIRKPREAVEASEAEAGKARW